MVDTTDEWITQRTGIRERHIAARGRDSRPIWRSPPRARRWPTQVDAQSIDLDRARDLDPGQYLSGDAP